MADYTGKQKISFKKRLGEDWKDLADYFEIPASKQNEFKVGDEPRAVWEWLDQHNKLFELDGALSYIGRDDICTDVLAAQEEPSEVSVKPDIVWSAAPYPGLRDFTEEEARIFFGRESEIQSLLQLMAKSRFVAVVGASGSGKSSLVRAGVIPRLPDNAGQAKWQSIRFTPGGLNDDPFLPLAAQLEPILGNASLNGKSIADSLRRTGKLPMLIEPYLAGLGAGDRGGAKLLLFIDQFEELFTITQTKYHHRFIVMLEESVKSPHIHIILTVRADFTDRCLAFPALARLWNSGSWVLAAPGLAALSRMITHPAKTAGLEFEAEVSERILDDTAAEPGALALMAYALEQLYIASGGDQKLSLAAYQSFGGVREAIGRHAQTTYDKLDVDAQTALADVFSALVTVDQEKGVPTRKRDTLDEVCKSDASKRFVDAFTDQRLLVKRRDANQDIVVEVAHEALLTRWPLLNEWIRERFADFCLLRQVRADAAEWNDNGQPASNLWPQERLDKVEAMPDALKTRLEPHEREFVRPERQRLCDALENPALSHQERERIGYRLAEIGDRRDGVGTKKGLPDIVWCDVPGGTVELERAVGTFDVQPFRIAKYPVTYAQYRAFVESGDGYRNDQWWDGLGREAEPWDQFRKVDNHPAESVSWYDAMACCRWLSAKLGDDIRLPTEWEWQQAATGGYPAHRYPWGKEFESDRTNTHESGLGRTTAVGLYPQGVSTCGAMDMSGNVWEWCINDYDNPKNQGLTGEGRRVLRGGSWDDSPDYARAAYRFNVPPVDRYSMSVFGCVVRPPSVSS